MVIPEYIRDTIWEKKYGLHDYKWRVYVTIPAGTKIKVLLYIPTNEVWMEQGYELDVSALDVIKMSHYHDGRPQFEDLLITENTLSLYYAKFEIVETIAAIYLENTDTVNDHTIECVGFYRVIPRKVYVETYEKV